MDAVVEVASDSCSDRDRAEAGIVAAIAGARAPKRGGAGHWKVVLRVSKLAKGGREAEATIIDDAGVVVSQRTVSDPVSRTCLPLARAVGAWATLVLDDELTRARSDSEREKRDEAPVVDTSETRVARAADSDTGGTAPREFHFDLGTAMFVKSGFGSGSIAGVAPFVAFEVAPSWLLRPSITMGRSTGGTVLQGSTYEFVAAGARVDFCRRIPGNYIERRGIELDLCAGTDFSVLWDRDVSGTRATIGPSMDLRGELGAGIAAEVRGMGGIAWEQSQLRGAGAQSRFGGAVELGLSMRFP